PVRRPPRRTATSPELASLDSGGEAEPALAREQVQPTTEDEQGDRAAGHDRGRRAGHRQHPGVVLLLAVLLAVLVAVLLAVLLLVVLTALARAVLRGLDLDEPLLEVREALRPVPSRLQVGERVRTVRKDQLLLLDGDDLVDARLARVLAGVGLLAVDEVGGV